MSLTFIDTPGHVDFSSEMERTLQILDYAILIISGLDGVQSHTQTIWKLLELYHIPTFIFVNKMDISSYDTDDLLNDLQNHLSDHCLNMNDDNLLENIAMCDERLLNLFIDGKLEKSDLQKAIESRKIFPCFFGSALKNEGIQDMLEACYELMLEPAYPDNFGAQIYKISRDGNEPLVHMKITGGTLNVKDAFHDEKVDQIRMYSGLKYNLVSQAHAGDICVVTGLKKCKIGDGLGYESQLHQPVLEPYMNYRVILPPQCDQYKVLNQLQQLGQEDPQLHMIYQEESKELSVELMGAIQIEVLQKLIEERYHVSVEFDRGQLVYKETIKNPVIGVGHFEPLRHYAEVHLLLEPLPMGSGLVFDSQCQEDVLEKHWQRLILTHLQEKIHKGVLIGAPITDMKITLIAGRAHQKHTEGGDFRQATYRAVRQGLAQAESVLLEPYLDYELMIPSSALGKALFDIESMHGTAQVKDAHDIVYIVGKAPAQTMQNYQNDVLSYTQGKGRLTYQMRGYEPCFDQERIIDEYQYHFENDLDNPTGSVFCQHGAGFYVPYDQVANYKHIDLKLNRPVQSSSSSSYSSHLSEDDELEHIFTRTYGPVKRHMSFDYYAPQKEDTYVSVQKQKQQCLLVDGYNVIHAWPELKDIAKDNLDGARFRLLDMMCNYQGYKKCLLIVVFDAYKVPGNLGQSTTYHNIHVVYTKEKQTADMYIERATRQMANDYQITVATSDALEQLIVTGAGAYRMSSRELRLDYQNINTSTQQKLKEDHPQSRNFALENINFLKNDK